MTAFYRPCQCKYKYIVFEDFVGNYQMRVFQVQIVYLIEVSASIQRVCNFLKTVILRYAVFVAVSYATFESTLSIIIDRVENQFNIVIINRQP